MPVYLYQFRSSPTFQGAVEAEDPGKAVNKIKQAWPNLKHFRGFLFEVHGLRISPVPEHDYCSQVANGAKYYQKRRLVLARQRIRKLYDRRRTRRP
jgi:hypothetical protein